MKAQIEAWEKLIRIIFCPCHFDEKKQKLKTGAFRPPAGRDEVSVNRLRIVDENLCKKFGMRMSAQNNSISYLGFASVNASAVRSAGANVKATPTCKNRGHADIYYGQVISKGQPLPPEMAFTIKNILKSCCFYLDPEPRSNRWNGPKL